MALVSDEALSHLATGIADAIPIFIEEINEINQPSCAISTEIDDASSLEPSDSMSQAEVLFELRVSRHQLRKLVLLWGFPASIEVRGSEVYCRHDVERWMHFQPDPLNFASVLRLRRRRASRVSTEAGRERRPVFALSGVAIIPRVDPREENGLSATAGTRSSAG